MKTETEVNEALDDLRKSLRNAIVDHTAASRSVPGSYRVEWLLNISTIMNDLKQRIDILEWVLG